MVSTGDTNSMILRVELSHLLNLSHNILNEEPRVVINPISQHRAFLAGVGPGGGGGGVFHSPP